MDQNYYDYLNTHSPHNPIIKTAVNLIIEKSNNRSTFSVVDLGCFNGVILNEIYLKLPAKRRNKIKLIGLDSNEEALTKGKNIFPHIIFFKCDFECNNLPLLSQCDIVIISNVLHEIYSNSRSLKKNKVKSFITRAINLLKPGGCLLILDGIKPDNPQRAIRLTFKNKTVFSTFLLFAKSYKVLEVSYIRISDMKVKTDLAGLTAFMTKARYLNKSYWKKEKQECYQFFNLKDYKDCLRQLKNIQFSLQKIPRQKIFELFSEIKPEIEVIKNILVVGQK